MHSLGGLQKEHPARTISVSGDTEQRTGLMYAGVPTCVSGGVSRTMSLQYPKSQILSSGGEESSSVFSSFRSR